MGGTGTVTMVRYAVAKVLLPENNQSGSFCILEPSLDFMTQHLSQVRDLYLFLSYHRVYL